MTAAYFISYATPDRAWAEWIGWALEEEGASVVLQAWDFRPGSNFVLEMQRAAAAAKRTIALLSPDYMASHFAAPEWAAAFAQDPEGLQRRLVPVRVRDCALDGMLRTIVYIDLVELDEGSAHKALVGGLAAKRGKPDQAPPFPGTIAGPGAKPFPGIANRGTATAGAARNAPYMPHLRGAISDLDRSRFIRQAFETVKDHFEKGLEALAARPAIDADLTRRGDTEFVAEVYVSGKRAARCRIWLGGIMGGSNEIAYYEGDYDAGNSMNELLSIADDRDGLAMKAHLCARISGHRGRDTGLATSP